MIQLILSENHMDRIHYSMFDVGRSMFISFFFDLTEVSNYLAYMG
ncbi:hypothetical protein D1BOALGB6SA_6458 [Olavius sp. associated proteobacterium Delta 1]|nr:hypothetical protein D1BOALGB6SA_6458 [Olavius sp. associated proteobacterium Delta 1]